jgi:hypothetical protein
MNKNKYEQQSNFSPPLVVRLTLGGTVMALTALSTNIGDVMQTANAVGGYGSGDIVKSIDHHPHIHSDIVIDRRHISSRHEEEQGDSNSDKSRDNWAIYDIA